MKTETGYSLIEVFISLTIVVILIGAVTVTLRGHIFQNRLTTHAKEIAAELRLARSEAITRGRTVTVCRSAEGKNCETSRDGWEDGWIVFVNNDSDDPPLVDEGETILKVHPGFDWTYTLRGDHNVSESISFDMTGNTKRSGSLVLCKNGDPAKSRALFVNRIGRVTVGADDNENGILEDGDSKDRITVTP